MENMVLTTPDYFAVVPMGVSEFAILKSQSETLDDLKEILNNSIFDNNPNSNGPTFKLSEEDKNDLQRAFEEYMNRELTIANTTMRNELTGAIVKIEEARKQLKVATDTAQAMLDNHDIAVITDNEALASQINIINAAFGNFKAQVGQLNEAFANSEKAVAQQLERFEADIADKPSVKAAITRHTQAEVSKVNGQIQSVVRDVNTLRSTVNGMDNRIDKFANITNKADRFFATAGTMLTKASGGKVGWQFISSDGSTSNSSDTFDIYTNKFRLYNSDGRRYFTFEVNSDGHLVLGNNVIFSTRQVGTILAVVTFRWSAKASLTGINPAQHFVGRARDIPKIKNLLGNLACSAVINLETFQNFNGTQYLNNTYIIDRAAYNYLLSYQTRIDIAGGGVATVMFFNETFYTHESIY